MLVRWLYVWSLIVITAVSLFGMLMSWWLASWAGWAFRLGIPICGAAGLVFSIAVRLVCEQLIRWPGPEAQPQHEYAVASPHPPAPQPQDNGDNVSGPAGAPGWTNY
jgi:hypothetical protein